MIIDIFTNEFNFDETITTILDNKGTYEDIQLFIDDNGVYIRQWNEINQEYALIILSHQMFTELNIAISEDEGAFLVMD